MVLEDLDPCAGNIGELTEEIVPGGGELAATNESPVPAKTMFDPVVAEDGQDDGRLSDPPAPIRAIGEALHNMNDFLNQLVTSEENPRLWIR